MAFATAIAPQEKGPPPALGAWRVLVVEDVPSQQKLLFLMLTKAGHRVSCADNGREAVALAAEQVFDVVLMDVQMPGMNGLDATRAIRAGEAQTGRHAAIVAITAHALPGDAEKCLAAGTDAYMRKPVNLVELMSLLKRLTGGEEMAN
ncbi:MAG TPA: response regulator [Planctomycetaceae bacterium]|nr:response regulator [Planctomycetaceae bacterium]